MAVMKPSSNKDEIGSPPSIFDRIKQVRKAKKTKKDMLDEIFEPVSKKKK